MFVESPKRELEKRCPGPPYWEGRPAVFCDVPVGEFFHLYYPQANISHTYRKTKEVSRNGFTTNAELWGSPTPSNPQHQWFEPDQIVYVEPPS